ncbi:MAG: hypothetical protein U9Q74_10850 [Gemmatimonadota bacterium]|nr:hypothetical protein [Gemmatimonadota bacterium]
MRRLLPVLALALACKTDKAPVAATIHEMAITGSDFSFQAPDSIPAGVTHVSFTNKGPGFHHVQFVRLDSGKTLTDLEAALKNPGPPPGWAVFSPGPNAPDPGGSSNATVNFSAGNWAIICLVDLPGGVPHFAKGMVHPLTVTPSSGAVAAMPPADVTLEVADYAFTLSKPLAAGKQVVSVVAKGPQPHEVEIVRFEPGKTMDDMMKWFDKPNGPPPAHGVGGTTAQLPGEAVQFSVELTPGDYALVCFIPDAKDGKPHLAHGMLHPFKIG